MIQIGDSVRYYNETSMCHKIGKVTALNVEVPHIWHYRENGALLTTSRTKPNNTAFHPKGLQIDDTLYAMEVGVKIVQPVRRMCVEYEDQQSEEYEEYACLACGVAGCHCDEDCLNCGSRAGPSHHCPEDVFTL